MKCPNCNEIVDKKLEKCPQCGTLLREKKKKEVTPEERLAQGLVGVESAAIAGAVLASKTNQKEKKANGANNNSNLSYTSNNSRNTFRNEKTGESSNTSNNSSNNNNSNNDSSILNGDTEFISSESPIYRSNSSDGIDIDTSSSNNNQYGNYSDYNVNYDASNSENYNIVNNFLSGDNATYLNDFMEENNMSIEDVMELLNGASGEDIQKTMHDAVEEYVKELVASGQLGENLSEDDINGIIDALLKGETVSSVPVLDRNAIEAKLSELLSEELSKALKKEVKVDFKLTEEVLDLTDITIKEINGKKVYIDKDGKSFTSLEALIVEHTELIDMQKVLELQSDYKPEEPTQTSNYTGGRIDINPFYLGRAIVALGGPEIVGQGPDSGWDYLTKKTNNLLTTFKSIPEGFNKNVTTIHPYPSKPASSNRFNNICKNILKGAGAFGSGGDGLSEFMQELHAQLVDLKTKIDNLDMRDAEGNEIFDEKKYGSAEDQRAAFDYVFYLTAGSYATGFGSIYEQSDEEIARWISQYQASADENKTKAWSVLESSIEHDFNDDDARKRLMDELAQEEFNEKWLAEHGNLNLSDPDVKAQYERELEKYTQKRNGNYEFNPDDMAKYIDNQKSMYESIELQNESIRIYHEQSAVVGFARTIALNDIEYAKLEDDINDINAKLEDTTLSITERNALLAELSQKKAQKRSHEILSLLYHSDLGNGENLSSSEIIALMQEYNSLCGVTGNSAISTSLFTANQQRLMQEYGLSEYDVELQNYIINYEQYSTALDDRNLTDYQREAVEFYEAHTGRYRGTLSDDERAKLEEGRKIVEGRHFLERAAPYVASENQRRIAENMLHDYDYYAGKYHSHQLSDEEMAAFELAQKLRDSKADYNRYMELSLKIEGQISTAEEREEWLRLQSNLDTIISNSNSGVFTEPYEQMMYYYFGASDAALDFIDSLHNYQGLVIDYSNAQDATLTASENLRWWACDDDPDLTYDQTEDLVFEAQDHEKNVKNLLAAALEDKEYSWYMLNLARQSIIALDISQSMTPYTDFNSELFSNLEYMEIQADNYRYLEGYYDRLLALQSERVKGISDEYDQVDRDNKVNIAVPGRVSAKEAEAIQARINADYEARNAALAPVQEKLDEATEYQSFLQQMAYSYGAARQILYLQMPDRDEYRRDSVVTSYEIEYDPCPGVDANSRICATNRVVFYDANGKKVTDTDEIACYCVQNGIYIEGDECTTYIGFPTQAVDNLLEISKYNYVPEFDSHGVQVNRNYNPYGFETSNAYEAYYYLHDKYGIDVSRESFDFYFDLGAQILGYTIADERIRRIREANYAAGREDATFWDDVNAFFMVVGQGLEDGLYGWAENLDNLFNADGRKSSTEYRNMHYIEHLSLDADFRDTIFSNSYELSSSIGNMLPSIAINALVSALTCGFGAGLGWSVFAQKALQFSTTFASMGLSAWGGAKEQAMQMGMDEGTALFYGLLSGLSETALESVIGSLPGIGHMEKVLEGSKSLFVRFFGKMLSEGIEESTQEIFDSFLLAAFTGQPVEIDWNAVLKSGVYGALTSGIMSMAGGIINVGKMGLLLGTDLVNMNLDLATPMFDAIAERYAGLDLTNPTTLEAFYNDIGQIKNFLEDVNSLASPGTLYSEMAMENAENVFEQIKSDLLSDPKIKEDYNNDPRTANGLSFEAYVADLAFEKINEKYEIDLRQNPKYNNENLIISRSEMLSKLESKIKEFNDLKAKLGLDESQIQDMLFSHSQGNIAAESKLLALHAEIATLQNSIENIDGEIYKVYKNTKEQLLRLQNIFDKNADSLSVEELIKQQSIIDELQRNVNSYEEYIENFLRASEYDETFDTIRDKILYDENSIIQKSNTFSQAEERIKEYKSQLEEKLKERENLSDDSMSLKVDEEIAKLRDDIKKLESLKENLQTKLKNIDIRLQEHLNKQNEIVNKKLSDINAENGLLNKNYENDANRIDDLQREIESLNEQLKTEMDFNKLKDIKSQIDEKNRIISELQSEMDSLQSKINKNNSELERITNGKIVGINSETGPVGEERALLLRAISEQSALVGILPNLRQLVVNSDITSRTAPTNMSNGQSAQIGHIIVNPDRTISTNFNETVNEGVDARRDSDFDTVPVREPANLPRRIDINTVENFLGVENKDVCIEFLKNVDVKNVIINQYSDDSFEKFIFSDQDGSMVKALFDSKGLEILGDSEQLNSRLKVIFENPRIRSIVLTDSNFTEVLIENIENITDVFENLDENSVADRAFLNELANSINENRIKSEDVLAKLNEKERTYLTERISGLKDGTIKVESEVNDKLSEVAEGVTSYITNLENLLSSVDNETDISEEVRSKLKSIALELSQNLFTMAQYTDFATQLRNIKEILNSKTKTNEDVNNDLFEQASRNIDSLLSSIDLKKANIVDRVINTAENRTLESNLAENRFRESLDEIEVVELEDAMAPATDISKIKYEKYSIEEDFMDVVKKLKAEGIDIDISDAVLMGRLKSNRVKNVLDNNKNTIINNLSALDSRQADFIIDQFIKLGIKFDISSINTEVLMSFANNVKFIKLLGPKTYIETVTSRVNQELNREYSPEFIESVLSISAKNKTVFSEIVKNITDLKLVKQLFENATTKEIFVSSLSTETKEKILSINNYSIGSTAFVAAILNDLITNINSDANNTQKIKHINDIVERLEKNYTDAKSNDHFIFKQIFGIMKSSYSSSFNSMMDLLSDNNLSMVKNIYGTQIFENLSDNQLLRLSANGQLDLNDVFVQTAIKNGINNNSQTCMDILNKSNDINLIVKIMGLVNNKSAFINALDSKNLLDILNENAILKYTKMEILAYLENSDVINDYVGNMSSTELYNFYKSIHGSAINLYKFIPRLSIDNVTKLIDVAGNYIFNFMSINQLTEYINRNGDSCVKYLDNSDKLQLFDLGVINIPHEELIDPRSYLNVGFNLQGNNGNIYIILENIINSDSGSIYVYSINNKTFYSDSFISYDINVGLHSRAAINGFMINEFLSDSNLAEASKQDGYLGRIKTNEDGSFTIDYSDNQNISEIINNYLNNFEMFLETTRDGNGKLRFGADQDPRRILGSKDFINKKGVGRFINSASYSRLVEFFANKYNLSPDTIRKILLNKINVRGPEGAGTCSYADIANSIFYTFKDNALAFKKTFGFDMYEFENGKKILNSRMLLADIFIRTNSTDLGVPDGSGGLPVMFTVDTATNQRVINRHIDENGKMVEYSGKNQVYMSNKSTAATKAVLKYLADYGITLRTEIINNHFEGSKLNIEALKADLKARMLNGEIISIGEYAQVEVDPQTNENRMKPGQPSLVFHNLDTKGADTETRNWNEGGGHTTVLVGFTEDGLLVISWGQKHEIKFSDLTPENCVFKSKKLDSPAIRYLPSNSNIIEAVPNMETDELIELIDSGVDFDYLVKNYISEEQLNDLVKSMDPVDLLESVKSARSVGAILNAIKNNLGQELYENSLDSLTSEQRIYMFNSKVIDDSVKLELLSRVESVEELEDLYLSDSEMIKNNKNLESVVSDLGDKIVSSNLLPEMKVQLIRSLNINPINYTNNFQRQEVSILYDYAIDFYRNNPEGLRNYVNQLSFDQLVEVIIGSNYGTNDFVLDALFEKASDPTAISTVLFTYVKNNNKLFDVIRYASEKSQTEIDNIRSKLTPEAQVEFDQELKDYQDNSTLKPIEAESIESDKALTHDNNDIVPEVNQAESEINSNLENNYREDAIINNNVATPDEISAQRRVENFFNYDNKVKSILSKSADMSASELIDAIDEIDSCLYRMIKGTSLEMMLPEIESRIKAMKEMLTNKVTDSKSLKQFKEQYIYGLSRVALDTISDNVMGYALFTDYLGALKNCNSLNELLHCIHHSALNSTVFMEDGAVPLLFRGTQLLETGNTTHDNEPIHVYGTSSELLENIYSALNNRVDAGEINILSLENKVLFMVRDVGHALTIEVTKLGNGKVEVSYQFPKITNAEKANKVKGIEKVDSNSVFGSGGFITDEEIIGTELRELIESIPTDMDDERFVDKSSEEYNQSNLKTEKISENQTDSRNSSNNSAAELWEQVKNLEGSELNDYLAMFDTKTISDFILRLDEEQINRLKKAGIDYYYLDIDIDDVIIPTNARAKVSNSLQDRTEEVVLSLKEEILSKITPEMSELEKARLIYYELGKKLDYDPLYRFALKTKDQNLYDLIYNGVATMDNTQMSKTIVCTRWAQIYSEMLEAAGFDSKSIVIQRLTVDPEVKNNNYVHNSHAAMYVILSNGDMIIPDMTVPFTGAADFYNIKVGNKPTGFIYVTKEQMHQISEDWKNYPNNDLEYYSNITTTQELDEDVRNFIEAAGSYFYGHVFSDETMAKLKSEHSDMFMNRRKQQNAFFNYLREKNSALLDAADKNITPYLSQSDFFIRELTEEYKRFQSENDKKILKDVVDILQDSEQSVYSMSSLYDLLTTAFMGLDNVSNRNMGTLLSYLREVADSEDIHYSNGKQGFSVKFILDTSTSNNRIKMTVYSDGNQVGSPFIISTDSSNNIKITNPEMTSKLVATLLNKGKINMDNIYYAYENGVFSNDDFIILMKNALFSKFEMNSNSLPNNFDSDFEALANKYFALIKESSELSRFSNWDGYARNLIETSKVKAEIEKFAIDSRIEQVRTENELPTILKRCSINVDNLSDSIRLQIEEAYNTYRDSKYEYFINSNPETKQRYIDAKTKLNSLLNDNSNHTIIGLMQSSVARYALDKLEQNEIVEVLKTMDDYFIDSYEKGFNLLTDPKLIKEALLNIRFSVSFEKLVKKCSLSLEEKLEVTMLYNNQIKPVEYNGKTLSIHDMARILANNESIYDDYSKAQIFEALLNISEYLKGVPDTLNYQLLVDNCSDRITELVSSLLPNNIESINDIEISKLLEDSLESNWKNPKEFLATIYRISNGNIENYINAQKMLHEMLRNAGVDLNICDDLRNFVYGYEGRVSINNYINVYGRNKGIDQGSIREAMNNLFDRSTRNRLINKVKQKYPGISTKQAIIFLNSIEGHVLGVETRGVCNYADVCNGIVEYFINHPKENFRSHFGFDLFDPYTGKINEAELLLDIYMEINGDNFITKNDSFGFSFSKYVSKKSNVGYRNLANYFDSDIPYAADAIITYLRKRGLNLTLKQKNELPNISEIDINKNNLDYYSNYILGKVAGLLSENKHVSLSYDGKIKMKSLKTGFTSTYDGCHIMSIVGVSDGNILVNTWGGLYSINVKQILRNNSKFTIDSFEFVEAKETNSSGPDQTIKTNKVSYDELVDDLNSDNKTSRVAREGKGANPFPRPQLSEREQKINDIAKKKYKLNNIEEYYGLFGETISEDDIAFTIIKALNGSGIDIVKNYELLADLGISVYNVLNNNDNRSFAKALNGIDNFAQVVIKRYIKNPNADINLLIRDYFKDSFSKLIKSSNFKNKEIKNILYYLGKYMSNNPSNLDETVTDILSLKKLYDGKTAENILSELNNRMLFKKYKEIESDFNIYGYLGSIIYEFNNMDLNLFRKVWPIEEFGEYKSFRELYNVLVSKGKTSELSKFYEKYREFRIRSILKLDDKTKISDIVKNVGAKRISRLYEEDVMIAYLLGDDNISVEQKEKALKYIRMLKLRSTDTSAIINNILKIKSENHDIDSIILALEETFNDFIKKDIQSESADLLSYYSESERDAFLDEMLSKYQNNQFISRYMILEEMLFDDKLDRSAKYEVAKTLLSAVFGDLTESLNINDLIENSSNASEIIKNSISKLVDSGYDNTKLLKVMAKCLNNYYKKYNIIINKKFLTHFLKYDETRGQNGGFHYNTALANIKIEATKRGKFKLYADNSDGTKRYIIDKKSLTSNVVTKSLWDDKIYSIIDIVDMAVNAFYYGSVNEETIRSNGNYVYNFGPLRAVFDSKGELVTVY